MKNIRVVGIDPGMTRLGLAGIELKDGAYELLHFGMIQHQRDADDGFNDHLQKGVGQIADTLPRFIGLIEPDFIAMELVPVGRLGSNDALVIAASVSCIIIAHQFGIPLINLAASTVKKQLTGDYKATKTVVKHSVEDLFPKLVEKNTKLKEEQKVAGEKATGFPPDIYDAIAIACVGAKMNEREEDLSEVQED